MIGKIEIDKIIATVLKYNKYFNCGHGLLLPMYVGGLFQLMDSSGNAVATNIIDTAKGSYFYLRKNGKCKVADSIINSNCNNNYDVLTPISLIGIVEYNCNANEDKVVDNLIYTLHRAGLRLKVKYFTNHIAEIVLDEVGKNGEYFKTVMSNWKNHKMIRIDFDVETKILDKNIDVCPLNICELC